MNNDLQTAVFGGGCFWCTEAVFQRLRGVEKVVSGYAGGTEANPSYDEVSMGRTGHAEVIKIQYNESVISYRDLLEVFFSVHDPTTPNQQGADVGTQYRSIILYTVPEQKALAEQIIAELVRENVFEQRIVTEIKALDKFYEAEDYHRDYYNQNQSQPYCQAVISPKLAKFRQKFTKLLKD